MNEHFEADIAALSQLIPEVMRKYRQTVLTRFQHSGLTPFQGILLGKLAQEGPCNASQIGAMMGITSGSVTSATERLITRGLVMRKRDERDRRIVIFTLTELAKQALQSMRDTQRSHLSAICEQLGPAKTAHLLALLSEVQVSLELGTYDTEK